MTIIPRFVVTGVSFLIGPYLGFGDLSYFVRGVKATFDDGK